MNNDTSFKCLKRSGLVLLSQIGCVSVEYDKITIDDVDVRVDWAVNDM